MEAQQTVEAATRETHAIFGVVVKCILLVVGDAFDADDITPATVFSRELELESIEFIALAEAIQNRYHNVNFAHWFSGKTLGEIAGLTVGDLVQFIHSCRS